jgi:hypothetical protein
MSAIPLHWVCLRVFRVTIFSRVIGSPRLGVVAASDRCAKTSLHLLPASQNTRTIYRRESSIGP